jgi:PAP_fibrillin
VELFGQPVKLTPPALQRLLPEGLRAASFRVTFLDDEMRVTRGDRSELRVFRRRGTLAA